jgi:hypothetical protein
MLLIKIPRPKISFDIMEVTIEAHKINQSCLGCTSLRYPHMHTHHCTAAVLVSNRHHVEGTKGNP